MVGGFRLFRIRFVSYLEFVVCGFYFGVRVVFAVHIEGGLLEASEGEAEASFEMFGAVGAEDKQLMVEFVHYFHRHCYVGGCRIVALYSFHCLLVKLFFFDAVEAFLAVIGGDDFV